MTGSEKRQFSWIFTVLFRTIFSLVAAVALCGAAEPFDLPDQRFVYSSAGHAHAAQWAAPDGGSDSKLVATAEDPFFVDMAAVDAADSSEAVDHSTKSVIHFCRHAPHAVYVVAPQRPRCGSRPRAPPAVLIG